MRTFMTGVNGFIGSRLSDVLIEKGHEVYGLVRYVSDRKLNLHKGVKVITGNLTDYQVLKGYMQQIKPEAVIHLAAQSAVRESFNHPTEFMETNLIGTVNLAEANKENPNLEKFLYAGTSEEYGNQDEFPIKENFELRPNTPYAISKVAADMYLQYMIEAYNFPACVLRPFNTFGRKNNFGFVTERIIFNMLQNQDFSLGAKDPVRDFLYVDDHVNGYVKALESKVTPKAVNICTRKGWSIGDWAYEIAELIGYDFNRISWNSSFKRPTEIDYLVGCNELAKQTIGWSPKYKHVDGLELLIQDIEEKIGYNE